jgi:hypothetical protein
MFSASRSANGRLNRFVVRVLQANIRYKNTSAWQRAKIDMGQLKRCLLSNLAEEYYYASGY